MKKSIFMLLACIYVNLNFGQCACCGSSSNISAGETTPTAYALNKKQWLAELYSDYRSFSGNSNSLTSEHQIDNALNIKTMVIGGVGLRYGINNRTTLVIQQPYIFINASSSSSKAFGDLLSLINYRVLSKSNFMVGLQAGMEWPTGQYIVEGNGNSISTGSGSFDPAAGVNVMKALKKSNLRFNAFFKYTTKGFNQTNYGNFFSQQIGYTYFVLNPIASCSSDSISGKSTSAKPTLAFNFQISAEWMQMQMKNYAIIENTGGYTVQGGLGATIGFKRFSIPVLVTLPVFNHMHGHQNINTVRLRIGISKVFN